MEHGYLNKLLRFDLTASRLEEQPLNQEWAEKYIGGSGLATRYLREEITPTVKSDDPENPLLFMTGPTCGTKTVTSGRHHVVSLSPLTRLYGESDVGGTWGRELKRAGYDGLLITGRAEHPAYLWINDGRVDLRNADHIQALDPFQLDPLLKEETDPKAVVACVGPAAARGVLIANIIHNGRHSRAAGRCGLGAVMGFKNLKAVVVRGTGDVSVSDPVELTKSVRHWVKHLSENMIAMRRYGTAGSIPASEQLGAAPLANWKYPRRWAEGAEKTSGLAIESKGYIVRSYFCAGCPIGCGKTIQIPSGAYRTEIGGGPEYETLSMFGGNCLVDDLDAICFANELCNRYGIDTIEAGSLTAFAMEAFERGLITASDTGGLDLRFGSADAMVECVRMIGEAQHIGKTLGRGLRHAVERIGPSSEAFAIHVKGLAIPAHDPRAYNGLACAYATSARGAHHTDGHTHAYEHCLEVPELNHVPFGRLEVKDKGRLTAMTQNVMCVLDSVKSCKFAQFGGYTIGPVCNDFRMVTGRTDTLKEMIRHGERIVNLKRLINVDRGVSRKDDQLPKRMLTLAKRADGYTPNLPPLDQMLDEYYQTRGWSSDGIPLPETIDRLEI